MKSTSLKYRSLLTETLPFEVPVIFSNDALHASLVAPPAKGSVIEKFLVKVRDKKQKYTKPYSYQITKGDARATTLGIIHPVWQIEIAEFYDRHGTSLLNYCSHESFSLRRPAELASPFVENAKEEDDSRLKLGVAQLAADAGEPDVSHMTQYFVYRKYNLLGKYIESREYLRLEARFLYQRSVDVAKCFYNIYTHSISWAVKDKPFAKRHATSYSVEAELDRLMQKANYNETNGIVVGPEFSRIFAEIIFQDIDRKIESDMDECKWQVTKDYDVRRYVDDYFIYANDEMVLNRVEKSLRKHLEVYKLFVNERKLSTIQRPFVTKLSLARQEIGALLRSVSALVNEIRASENDQDVSSKIRSVQNLLREVRLVVKKYEVGFESISGWLLSRLKKVVYRLFREAEKCESANRRQHFVDVSIAILEITLHVVALDLRVRPTYSLCQLALLFSRNRSLFTAEQMDSVDHVIMEETVGILRTMRARKQIGKQVGSDGPDSVEAYNLLICGAHFVGDEFLRSTMFLEIVDELLSSEKLSYFAYVSIKFCLLKREAEFGNRLDALNDKVTAYLLGDECDVWFSAEDYLLFCDLVSAPDVGDANKKIVVEGVLGGEISKVNAGGLGPYLGFVDWRGLSVEHLLRRKALRPVYAWS